MRRLEVEDVEDSLYQVVVVFPEELGDNFVVVLQYFLEGEMHGVFLKLNSVVDDDFEPFLADVKFGNWIVLDDLPNEVVGSVEDRLQCLVLSFQGFVDFLKDLLADLPDYREQLRANLQVHADVLQLLVGQHFSLDVRKTAVLDKRYQFLQSKVDMLQLLRFYLLLELLSRICK